MSKPVKRIGIFGNFGGHNFGNEGTLEAFIAFLRKVRPDAELVCICHDPSAITARYGIDAFAMRQPAKAGSSFPAKVWRRGSDAVRMFRALREVDVLIVPGTGILDDFGEPPRGLPFTLLSLSLSARLHRVPLWFVSIGAGPIRHSLSRRLMKTAVTMASYCSYRDVISKDFMAGLGVRTEEHPVYPDLAFALPKARNAPPETSPPLRVGVGVMAYFGWSGDPETGSTIYETYLDKMTDFVVWLLDRGHSVRLLQGEKTDEKAISDLLARLVARTGEPIDDRVIAEDTNSLADLMQQIGQLDIVVATRFHNAVCALKMERPVVSVGYAKKNDALLEEWGLGDYCQYVEDFDVDLLKLHFTQLMDRVSRGEFTTNGMAERYERRLNEQDTLLTLQLERAAE